MSYHLKHNRAGYYLPFPFVTREAAEQHIDYLKARGTYTVIEITPQPPAQEILLQQEDREFENTMLDHFVEYGYDLVQL